MTQQYWLISDQDVKKISSILTGCMENCEKRCGALHILETGLHKTPIIPVDMRGKLPKHIQNEVTALEAAEISASFFDERIEKDMKEIYSMIGKVAQQGETAIVFNTQKTTGKINIVNEISKLLKIQGFFVEPCLNGIEIRWGK